MSMPCPYCGQDDCCGADLDPELDQSKALVSELLEALKEVRVDAENELRWMREHYGENDLETQAQAALLSRIDALIKRAGSDE